MHSSETKQKEKQKQNEWNGQENKALEEFINTFERISKFIKAKVCDHHEEKIEGDMENQCLYTNSLQAN